MILALLKLLVVAELCVGSVFAYPGDKWAGGVSPYLGRRVKPTDNGIAHRWLPMGSRVLLINARTHKVTVSRVIDRGPFGVIGEKPMVGVRRWRAARAKLKEKARALELKGRAFWRYVNGGMRHLDPEFNFRGCADLTPRVKRRLRHNGLEPVWVVPL